MILKDTVAPSPRTSSFRISTFLIVPLRVIESHRTFLASPDSKAFRISEERYSWASEYIPSLAFMMAFFTTPDGELPPHPMGDNVNGSSRKTDGRSRIRMGSPLG